MLLDDCRGVADDVFLLAHEGYGFVAAVERYMDYLGALGNEDAFAGLIFAAQLRFGECAEELASGMVECGYLYDWHVCFFAFVMQKYHSMPRRQILCFHNFVKNKIFKLSSHLLYVLWIIVYIRKREDYGLSEIT